MSSRITADNEGLIELLLKHHKIYECVVTFGATPYTAKEELVVNLPAIRKKCCCSLYSPPDEHSGSSSATNVVRRVEYSTMANESDYDKCTHNEH